MRTALALILFAAAPAHALTVKLATLAPDDSIWHRHLKETAEAWSKATGGAVTMRIYPGGVAGNEGDMIRKVRIGQLHGAMITAVGLREITPEAQGIMLPGIIGTGEELDYVMEHMAPRFEKLVLDKGFVVIDWGEAGWVHFFGQKPVRTPEDQKKLKIFAWAGDPGALKAYQSLGFNPVVISSTDLLPSLQTGLIQSFNGSALTALSIGAYQYARYMTRSTWGVIIGATVVNKSTWDKVPEAQRPTLLKLARDGARKLQLEVRKKEDEAIEAMKKNGLTVMEQTPEEMAAWEKAQEKTWVLTRDVSVPGAIIDEIKKHRDEFRAKQAKK
jgi:TRAP-type C4-dicarboxylate transport system substrate-binding protein